MFILARLGCGWGDGEGCDMTDGYVRFRDGRSAVTDDHLRAAIANLNA